MDTRHGDYIGGVEVRSDDSQEIKSIELFRHQFTLNDATGEVEFADDGVRRHLLEQVQAAILLTAHHEIGSSIPNRP